MLKEYIKKLNNVSLDEAGNIVDNDTTLSDDDKIYLLEYLVDRKINETDYTKCKRISGRKYIDIVESEEKMNMNNIYQSKKEYNNVIKFLNNFICGANMNDDYENSVRASRALKAFCADIDMNIFTDEFKDELIFGKE